MITEYVLCKTWEINFDLLTICSFIYELKFYLLFVVFSFTYSSSLRNKITLCYMLSTSLVVQSKFKSSQKNIWLDSNDKYKPFINKINSNGPKIDPWGILEVAIKLFYATHILLRVRYTLTSRMRFSLHSCCYSLLSRIQWSNLSKACEKYVYTTRTWPLLSI